MLKGKLRTYLPRPRAVTSTLQFNLLGQAIVQRQNRPSLILIFAYWTSTVIV